MTIQVTVIDYGMGNLLSVCRAIEHLGAEVIVADQADAIHDASCLILPGVGAFGDGMNELQQREMIAPIQKQSRSGTPLLGICLGAQMLLDSSDEFGHHAGLGIIPGESRPIPSTSTQGDPIKVPHVGWSDLIVERTNPLLNGLPNPSAVYFVHSYYCHLLDVNHLTAYCKHGGHPINAIFTKGKVTGCQFHPEKSGPVGLHILRNFLEQAQ